MSTVGFEGLVAPDGFATVPDGYAGLDWTNAGVLGKTLVRDVYPAGGYRNVLDQKGVAYLYGDDGNTGNAGFALAEGTFTLKSGTFASAWNTGDQVTFAALLDGAVVGTKHVVLDETATEITFGRHFRHIDAVEITWTQGIVVDPAAGSGPYLAVDGLKIAIDQAAHDWADWPFA